MESAHASESEQTVGDGGDASMQDTAGHQDDLQVEDSQYHEFSDTRSVPLKAGDEEVVVETQLRDERPRTTGSTSSQFEFDNSPGAAFLAEMMASNQQNQEAALITRAFPSVPLARPDLSGDSIAGTGFSFARASRQHLDFNGTRKIQAVSGEPGIERTDEAAASASNHQEESQQGQLRQFDHGGQRADHDLTKTGDTWQDAQEVPTVNAEESSQVERPVTHSNPHSSRSRTGKPKDRNKRSRKHTHYHTANSESVPNDPYALQDVHDATQTSNDMMEIVQKEPRERSSTNDEAKHEVTVDERHATPTSELAHAQPQSEVSSPHMQLQEDLEVASEQAQAPEQPAETEYTPSGMLLDQNAQPARANSATYPSVPNLEKQQQRSADRHDSIDHSQLGMSAGQLTGGKPPSKPKKRSSKLSRRATAPAPAAEPSAMESSFELGDYFQILQYKVHQHKQAIEAKYASDNEQLQSELQRMLDAKQILQDHLDAVEQEMVGLTNILESEQAKVAKYESKVGKLQTFVNGLGKDVGALKKDASSTHRKYEELKDGAADSKAEQRALFEQMAACAEKSAQLKHEALKALRDAQSELQAAVISSDYFRGQLDEKVGLLSEERDRRTQLEKQLANTASSDEKITRLLKANNNAVLDKLFEMHVTLEGTEGGTKASGLVQSTLAAVQDLIGQHRTSNEELITVKGLTEALTESLSQHIENSESNKGDDGAAVSTLQRHLDDALRSLKDDIARRDQSLQQQAASRENAASLQEKLKACIIRVADMETKLADKQANEAHLAEQNSTLQARVSALQSKASPEDNAHLQLGEAKAELAVKLRALETAKNELATKTEEVRRLHAANASLQEQVQSLHVQLSELQSTATDFAPQREELERQAKAELENMRHVMSVHANQVHEDDKNKFENQLKKLTSDRDKLNKKLKPVADELAKTQVDLEELKKQAAATDAQNKREVERLTKLKHSHEQELQTLQASLKDAKSSSKSNSSVNEQYKTLLAQHDTLMAKHQEVDQERTALQKRIEDCQQIISDAQGSERQLITKIEKLRGDSEAALQELQQQVADAQAQMERSSEGMKQLNESCKQAVQNEKDRSKKNIDALNNRVAEEQAALQQKHEEGEKFREEIELTWKQEQDAFKAELLSTEKRATEAEAQKDEAIAKYEHLHGHIEATLRQREEALRKELQQSQARLADSQAPSQPLTQQAPASRGSNVSSSRLRVPSVRDGVTPSASVRSTAPTRPRKKVDRNSNAMIEVGPVPAPETLRPISRNANGPSDKQPSRGPVIEESQEGGVVSDPFGHHAAIARGGPTKPTPFGFFSDQDSMLDSGAQTIAETQAQHEMPSFAAFNTSTVSSSQVPKFKPASSVLSVPSVRGAARRDIVEDTNLPPQCSLHPGHPQTSQPNDHFTIYEDSQPGGSSKAEDVRARQLLQDSLSWSQAEKDKYTFQMSYPPPNSASKMTPLPHKDQRQEDETQQYVQRYQTPEVRGEAKKSSEGVHPTRSAHLMTTHSSSPDFVHDATSGRKKRTYHTPGGSGSAKRRLSRKSSGLIVDPRLTAREQQTLKKRKAEHTIVEGYEHERKKRLSHGAPAAASAAVPLVSRFGGGARAPQSIRDLPGFPAMPAGPSSSSQASGRVTQSRMRTLAGGTSRTTRGVKKMTKRDEFDARFLQELGGR